MTRLHNFNAGPAALPLAVLEAIQAELLDYQGQGMSVMEMSHRSAPYEAINDGAQARLLRLLGLDDAYHVLFMTGGASTQFALVPLNFLAAGRTADYLMTGVWSDKALEEARRLGAAHVAASSKGEHYRRIPQPAEIAYSEAPAYVHLTSNNTIYGTQWHEWPDAPAPLVADMSSDILSRPFEASRVAMIYAGAQKNLGPSGVTVVVIRKEFLAEATADLPTMFRYQSYADSKSLYNTPPAFAVYVLGRVLEWIEQEGGAEAMGARNAAKAATLYGAIDGSGGFYRGHATPESRSQMNVTFRLPDEALEKQFIAEARAQGMVGLSGHRSVGGARASIYNATSLESCEALASFMADFAATRG